MISAYGQSKLIYLIAFLAGIGGFLFGYDTGAISGALLFIKKDFLLSTFQEEVTVSILLLSATISAIFAGILADRFGRKNIIIVSAFFFLVAAFIMAFSYDLLTLAAGRALVGVAIGIASMTVPLYVSELSPHEHRGFCVAINQLMITIGILTAYIVDYSFADTENWRIMLGLSAVPAFILLVSMFFLPETPRWLLNKGYKELAINVFHRLNTPEEEVDSALKIIHRQKKSALDEFKLLLNPQLRPALMAGIFLAILQQVTGINTVIYYAPSILLTVSEQSDTVAILSSIGIGSVNVIMTIVSLTLIDRWGRRPLLLIGTFLMVISLGVLGIANTMPHMADWIEWIYNGSLFLYIAGFAIGLGPVAWLFISEAYPQDIRGVAMSCATVANWGSNFLVSMTFLSLLREFGPSITFFLYAAIGVITLIFIYKKIPETKGKTLEEIQKFWDTAKQPT